MGLQIAQAKEHQQFSVNAQGQLVILNRTKQNKKIIATIVSAQMTLINKFQHIHKLQELNINSLTMMPKQEIILPLPGAFQEKMIGAT